MGNFSDNELKLFITVFGAICAMIGFFGRGLAFMAKRAVSGSKRQEDATYMASIVEIGAKLKESGMTTNDVQQVLDIVGAPNILSSDAAVEAVTGSGVVEKATPQMPQPAAFDSNYAMKTRTGSAIEVANAELSQALTDLELLVSDTEWKAMEIAQSHWRKYRDAISAYAYLEYEGGTHAGLAAGLVALAETERQATQIRSDVDERSRR